MSHLRAKCERPAAHLLFFKPEGQEFYGPRRNEGAGSRGGWRQDRGREHVVFDGPPQPVIPINYVAGRTLSAENDDETLPVIESREFTKHKSCPVETCVRREPRKALEFVRVRLARGQVSLANDRRHRDESSLRIYQDGAGGGRISWRHEYPIKPYSCSELRCYSPRTERKSPISTTVHSDSLCIHNIFRFRTCSSRMHSHTRERDALIFI